jgi:hypothetical protein
MVACPRSSVCAPDKPTDRPLARAQRVSHEGERVVSGLRQDCEGRSGLLREKLPHSAQQEKKTPPPPMSARGRAFYALGRAFVVVGRTLVVVGRTFVAGRAGAVGYVLLIVVATAVGMAVGVCVAVVLEYLIGWPDTLLL